MTRVTGNYARRKADREGADPHRRVDPGSSASPASCLFANAAPGAATADTFVNDLGRVAGAGGPRPWAEDTRGLLRHRHPRVTGPRPVPRYTFANIASPRSSGTRLMPRPPRTRSPSIRPPPGPSPYPRARPLRGDWPACSRPAARPATDRAPRASRPSSPRSTGRKRSFRCGRRSSGGTSRRRSARRPAGPTPRGRSARRPPGRCPARGGSGAERRRTASSAATSCRRRSN